MIDVKVGDTVIIAEGRDESEEVTVTKVGRAWLTVERGPHKREDRFRLDDQTDGQHIGWGRRFYTLDQWAEKHQADEASAFLREQGIEIGWTSPWRGREIELANLIRSAA